VTLAFDMNTDDYRRRRTYAMRNTYENIRRSWRTARHKTRRGLARIGIDLDDERGGRESTEIAYWTVAGLTIAGAVVAILWAKAVDLANSIPGFGG
jgi:hypothetical protein